MSRLTFTPFGRGSDASRDAQVTIFSALRVLSSGGLDGTNFQPDAAISERYVDWLSAGGHKHTDGSLGRSVLSTPHFQQTADDAGHARVVFTQVPKTQLLFGFVDCRLYTFRSQLNQVIVHFAESSFTHGVFAPGTTPLVFLSHEGADDASAEGYLFALESVTSTDFSFRVFVQDSFLGFTGRVWYFAIGVAPGYLAHPED